MKLHWFQNRKNLIMYINLYYMFTYIAGLHENVKPVYKLINKNNHPTKKLVMTDFLGLIRLKHISNKKYNISQCLLKKS